MTSQTRSEEIRVGTELFCNGYQGTVTEVCTGQLAGMAVVRLARGTVCTSIEELVRFRNFDATKAQP